MSHNAELITKWSPNKCQNAVVSDFKVIINAAKCKANMITMSSVCPQGDTDLQKCIDTVNAALKCFCADI